MTPGRRGWLVAGVCVAAGAALLGRQLPWRGPRGAVRRLDVPGARGPIVVDGETDEAAWRGAARTGALLGRDGVAARPFAEARALWGAGHLYLALYAADRDIRGGAIAADGPVWLGDHFHLAFRTGADERVLDVSPRGTLTDARRAAGGGYDYAWQSGAVAAVDADGTVDDPSDEDEEWSVELAIPLASLGLRGVVGEQLEIAIRRCDVPARGARACAAFGEGGVLTLR